MLRKQTVIIGAISAIVLLAVAAPGAVEIATADANWMTDAVIDDLAQVGRLQLDAERLGAASRSYLLTGSNQLKRRVQAIAAGFDIARGRITNVRSDELVRIAADARAYVDFIRDTAVAPAGAGNMAAGFERELLPLRLALERDLDALARREQRDFDTERQRRQHILRGIEIALVALCLLALVLVTLLSRWFAHALRQRAVVDRSWPARGVQGGERPRFLS